MTKTWKNRIIGYDIRKASSFLANEKNWRIHPHNQQDGLTGTLDEIGWIQDVIVNLRSSDEWQENKGIETLVDGHLRITLALRQGDDTPVPVKFVDLTPSEEALVLSTFDPIAAMAATDRAKLDELMQAVQSDDARVQQMMEIIKIKEGLLEAEDIENQWQGMPEFKQDNIDGIIITVHFTNIKDRQEFLEKTGIKFTDRTNSFWYPERPENAKNQLGRGLIYSDAE